MKKEIGLWIDHSEAVIVILTDGVEEIKRITSNSGKHILYSKNFAMRLLRVFVMSTPSRYLVLVGQKVSWKNVSSAKDWEPTSAWAARMAYVEQKGV